MSQILPPRGFKYSERTGPVADPDISASEYRLWKLLDLLAWDGTPLSGTGLNDLDSRLASHMGISPTRCRKLRASLVSRGLVVISTSGGMTTLEAVEAAEVEVQSGETSVEMLSTGDIDLSTATGEIVDNPTEAEGGVVINDQKWSKTSGQKRPQAERRGAYKLNHYSSYSSLFNKDGVVKNDHKRQEMTTGGSITPQLAHLCQLLQSLGIWRKPALAAARRALAENLTPDQLAAVARARIQQTDGNLARAAVLLRDEPLTLPQRPISDTKRRFLEELE
jgi:hypothetical protein